MPFCRNLKHYMESAHVTNYKLAKDIGVHQSSVKNWLDGMTPTLEYACRVADYFGTTVDEMMSDDKKCEQE